MTPTPQMDDQAETLDRYITNCMISAEATIHSHNMEDFSPKKVEATNTEKFWKLALQANRDNRDNLQHPNTTSGKYNGKAPCHGHVRH
jgi:hypothetical protein